MAYNRIGQATTEPFVSCDCVTIVDIVSFVRTSQKLPDDGLPNFFVNMESTNACTTISAVILVGATSLKGGKRLVSPNYYMNRLVFPLRIHLKRLKVLLRSPRKGM